MKIPHLVYESNPEKLEASYGTLLPLLVKSIQELSHKNQELSQEITDLKQEVTYLHQRSN
jgi:FtsZ-binding cell division protein ZapB